VTRHMQDSSRNSTMDFQEELWLACERSKEQRIQRTHDTLAHSESTNQIKLNGRKSGQTNLLQRARRPLPPPQPWPWSWSWNNSLVPIDDRSNNRNSAKRVLKCSNVRSVCVKKGWCPRATSTGASALGNLSATPRCRRRTSMWRRLGLVRERMTLKTTPLPSPRRRRG
jgi:hypothetical protein